MIRNVVVAAVLFSVGLVGSASAQTCAAYPNVLTNGTNADATQVMQNFDTIRTCANGLAPTSGATFTGTVSTSTTNVPDLTLYSGTVGLRIMTTNAAAAGFGGALTLGGSFVGTSQIGFASLRGGLEAVGDSSGYMGFYTTRSGVGSVEGIRLTSQGRVGIGTASPTYTLHVNGSVAGTSAYNNLSDLRLKKDIVALEYGIDTISKLRPVGFNWVTQDRNGRSSIRSA